MLTAPWFAAMNDGLGFRRNFALGSFAMYASRAVASPAANGVDVNPWWLGLRFDLQPTEQFAIDLGGNARLADNATHFNSLVHPATATHRNMTSITTYWGGLRFNFNQDVSLRGICCTY